MSTKKHTNTAAVLETAQAQVTIKDLPIPQAGPGELLVRNYAVAANPVDWKIQHSGYFIQKYPNVLGSDVAGIVEAVGPDVTKFKVGDRVTGFAAVIYNQEITHGAFQTYTLLRSIATTKLPPNISFIEGSVFPMAFATAACCLYVNLEISRPQINPESSKDEGFLVWGGASAVGIAVIQLAKNSGFKVFVAASQKHMAYLKSLGAYEVFDYHDSDVAEKIVEAAKSAGVKMNMGVDAIAEGDTAKLAADILIASSGGGKLVLTLPWPERYEKPKEIEVLNCGAYRLATDQAEFGEWFFNEYLQGSLENGSVISAPPVEVIKGGIGATQEGWDLLKKGVSGKKLVIEVE